jgi:membrane protease YdiL (CAAX protease family)
MRTPFELAVLATILVLWPAFIHFVSFPRMRARLATGAPGVRAGVYRTIALQEWALVMLAAAAAWAAHRPFADLGVRLRPGWGLCIGLGLCVAAGTLSWLQAAGVRRSPRRQERVRKQLSVLGDAALLLPRTPGEAWGFAGISVTAGCCEEFLFRGFAIWALSAWMPMWAAAAVSCAGFGIAHSYQGVNGSVRAGLVGVVMAALYLGSGSLLAVVILHAILDLGSGFTTYFALREVRPDEGVPPQPVGETR